MNAPCRELIPLVEHDVLARGGRARFTVSGSSMTPFIRDGDAVEIAALGGREIRAGEIVLAVRGNGAYVIHRVARTDEGRCYLLGDSQLDPEGPFTREQIIGRVASVWHGAHRMMQHRLRWRLAGRLWLTLRPCRRPCLSLMHGFWRGYKRLQSCAMKSGFSKT